MSNNEDDDVFVPDVPTTSNVLIQSRQQQQSRPLTVYSIRGSTQSPQKELAIKKEGALTQNCYADVHCVVKNGMSHNHTVLFIGVLIDDSAE